MKQLTVRGFEPELQRRLRQVARERGISLNQAALLLLRRGAGLPDPGSRPQPQTVGQTLDHLIGSWSKDEEQEFLNALEELERVDSSLWR